MRGAALLVSLVALLACGGGDGSGASSTAAGAGGGSSASASSSTAGGGGSAACARDRDCPKPAFDCFRAACISGICATLEAPAGTPCSDGACDAHGACVPP